MCRKVTCDKCSKPTWAGCGMHIEAALADVPVSERCKCREEAAAAGCTKGKDQGTGKACETDKSASGCQTN